MMCTVSLLKFTSLTSKEWPSKKIPGVSRKLVSNNAIGLKSKPPINSANSYTQLFLDNDLGLKYLLEKLKNSEDEDYLGSCSLYQSDIFYRAETTKGLLISGEDGKEQSQLEQTLLHVACKGRNAAMEAILEGVTDPDQWGKISNAAVSKNPEGIQKLLNQGAMLAYDMEREIMLETAVKANNSELVKGLIGLGANVNFRSQNGYTPLHFAACLGDERTIDALLDAGASTEIENNEGYTALHLASTRYGAQVIANHVADIDQKGASGITALHLAVMKGNVEVVKALITSGANPSEQDASNGDTPLHTIARTGDIRILKVLLEAGSMVNVKNTCKYTPLHTAARAGQVKVMEYLILYGADTEAEDNEFHTAVFTAALEGNLAVILSLKALGASMDPTDNLGFPILHTLVKNGAIDEIIMMAEYVGVDIDTTDWAGRTPLYLAAEKGGIEMMKELIGYGADVNMAAVDGSTPLHVATCKGGFWTVAFLLKHGAKSLMDRQAMSPLHYAAALGDLSIMELLIDHGANPNERNYQGLVAAQIAKRAGHLGKLNGVKWS